MSKAFLARAWGFLKMRYAPRGARISFSQSGEDIVMSDILRKAKIGKVFYVDIGAHQPVFGNNTYLFYTQGGEGVLVEPNQELCKTILRKRPHDVCVNAGAGKADGEADFFSFKRTTRSTFSKDQAKKWEETSGEKPHVEKLPVLSLNTIIREHCRGRIPDLVSIDAEGLDAEILSGFDWSSRPKVFCVEKAPGVGEIMEKHGYARVAEIFQNAIFVDTLL